MGEQVEAVVKTSISLPVKERIAQGLSRAGTSNTLKVVSYNAVLGVIAVFSSGAIRQFCAFSIVVLVAHWFLVHTFFVTVVSIDIQRLEASIGSAISVDRFSRVFTARRIAAPECQPDSFGHRGS